MIFSLNCLTYSLANKLSSRQSECFSIFLTLVSSLILSQQQGHTENSFHISGAYLFLQKWIYIMLNRSIQEGSNYGKRPALSVSGSPWEAAGQDRSRPNWWSGMIIIFHSLKASLCNVTFQLKICHLKMISYHIWFFKMMLKGGQNDVLSVMLKFNFTLEKNVPSYGF